MGSGRLSIKSFTSRSRSRRARRIFTEEDVDDLFGAIDTSASKEGSKPFEPNEEKHEDEFPDLNIVESDVFAGLTWSHSAGSEEEHRQAREDVDEIFEAKIPSSGHRDDGDNYAIPRPNHHDDDVYADFREEILADEESTSQSQSQSQSRSSGSTRSRHEMSTLPSSDTSNAVSRPNDCNDESPLACLEDPAFKQLLATTAHYGGKAGANIDEMNRFLFKELEVTSFAKDVEDLRQEMMKNGMRKLSEVEWAELFKSIYDPEGDCGGSPTTQESTALPSTTTAAEQEDCQEAPAPPSPQESNQRQRSVLEEIERIFFFTDLPDNACGTNFGADVHSREMVVRNEALIPCPVVETELTRCMLDMSDLVLEEEGMEMPKAPSFFEEPVLISSSSSGSNRPTPPKRVPPKKQKSFLSRLFPSPKGGGSARVAAAPVASRTKKTDVTRVQLRDGSMASVSVETVSRLQKCHWV